MAAQKQVQHFFQSGSTSQATCAARRVEFMGRSFRIVPSVLVRAQILNNNLGTTLLPEEEITSEWASQWNNIPVLVGPHPSVQGNIVSGRTPEILNNRGVGWIFNARAETVGGVRRLVGDVWLDESRAEAVPGLSAVLARLDNAQPVELSTGFGTHTDEMPGVYNGEPYQLVLHPAGPDHLVISTDFTGACSIAHGCGLGVNEEAKPTMDANETAAAGTEGTAGNDTPTQSVDGTAHPASDFAYVPDPATSSTWKLPIFDAAHVRDAIARFNQADISGSARTKAWRKILAAADRLNITVSDRTTPGHNTAAPSGFKGLLTKVAELFNAPTVSLSWENHEALRMKRQFVEMQMAPSDSERAQMLQEELQEEFGASDRDVIVCDVYTAPEQYVVFWFTTPMGPQPKGAEYYKAAWSVAADGTVDVQGPPVLVRRMTSYEPVGAEDNDPTAGNTAGGGERPAAEPAAAQVHNQQEEQQMDKETEKAIQDLTAAVGNLTKQVADNTAKVEGLSKQSAPAEIAGLKETVAELAGHFEEMRGVTQAAIDERERERQHLVKQLAGNHNVPFSGAELEAKPIEELRRLAQMAQASNFSGRGGPTGGRVQPTEARFATPRKYWEVPAKKEGE